MVAVVRSHYHGFVDRINIFCTRSSSVKSNRMFTERNVPEVMIVGGMDHEWTGETILRRQVAVMVLVPEMSNNMKCFREKQTKKPALRRGEAVMDFSEDMVTSWLVADFKSI